jgi:hypothetical protein
MVQVGWQIRRFTVGISVSAGYLYVLQNETMPGILKVGKTTRDPTDRASELSGTAVAVPFVVAYSAYYRDCDAAEAFVHDRLDRGGYRVSDQREFFRAPLADIIRLLHRAPGLLDGPHDPSLTPEDGLAEIASEGEDDAGSFSQDTSDRPWETILAEAEDAYYGLGDTLEGFDEALRLFKLAARLGSAGAFEYLGEMSEFGNGVRRNAKQALAYYREGTKRGNYICYARMGALYLDEGHRENAAKCWDRFFACVVDSTQGRRPTGFGGSWTVFTGVFEYLRRSLSTGAPPGYRVILREFREFLYVQLEERIAAGRRANRDVVAEVEVLRWAKRNLEEGWLYKLFHAGGAMASGSSEHASLVPRIMTPFGVICVIAVVIGLLTTHPRVTAQQSSAVVLPTTTRNVAVTTNAAMVPVAPATLIPTSTVALPPTPAPTATSPATWVLVGNTGGVGVYLRRTPHMDDQLKAWPDGTSLKVIGPDVDGDGHHWKNVQDPDGNVGWVPAEYVLVPGQRFEGGVTLASAIQVVAGRGYTAVPTDESDFARYSLRVLLGVGTGSANGHNQHAFFFLGDAYLGTDTLAPSAGINLIAHDEQTVTVRYALYQPKDPLCCPSGGSAIVRFSLSGGQLVPLDPIPTDDVNAPLSRR